MTPPRRPTSEEIARELIDQKEKIEALTKRLNNQMSHIQAYARCLDGLLTQEQLNKIPGSGTDGTRDAGEIRRVVVALAKQ